MADARRGKSGSRKTVEPTVEQHQVAEIRKLVSDAQDRLDQVDRALKTLSRRLDGPGPKK